MTAQLLLILPFLMKMTDILKLQAADKAETAPHRIRLLERAEKAETLPAVTVTITDMTEKTELTVHRTHIFLEMRVLFRKAAPAAFLHIPTDKTAAKAAAIPAKATLLIIITVPKAEKRVSFEFMKEKPTLIKGENKCLKHGKLLYLTFFVS